MGILFCCYRFADLKSLTAKEHHKAQSTALARWTAEAVSFVNPIKLKPDAPSPPYLGPEN